LGESSTAVARAGVSSVVSSVVLGGCGDGSVRRHGGGVGVSDVDEGVDGTSDGCKLGERGTDSVVDVFECVGASVHLCENVAGEGGLDRVVVVSSRSGLLLDVCVIVKFDDTHVSLVLGLPGLVRVLKESTSDGTVVVVLHERIPVLDEPIVLVEKSVARVLADLSDPNGLSVLARELVQTVKVLSRVSGPEVRVSGASVTGVGGDDVCLQITDKLVVSRGQIDESDRDGDVSDPLDKSVGSGIVEKVVQLGDDGGAEVVVLDGERELISKLPHEKSGVVTDIVYERSDVLLHLGSGEVEDLCQLGEEGKDDLESMSLASVQEWSVVRSISLVGIAAVCEHEVFGDGVGVVETDDVGASVFDDGEIAIPEVREPAVLVAGSAGVNAAIEKVLVVAGTDRVEVLGVGV